jgi:hypothetical protein
VTPNLATTSSDLNPYSSCGRRKRGRLVLAAVPIAVTVALLSSCSGASSKTQAAAKTDQNAQQDGGQRQFPGGSGELVALSGKTLQVQSSSSQTTVTYSGTTTFSKNVGAVASAVKVGMCVNALPKAAPNRSTSNSGTPNGSTPNGSTPNGSGSPSSDRVVTAATVLLSQPVNGECGGGFAGGGGGQRSGAPNEGSSGTPQRSYGQDRSGSSGALSARGRPGGGFGANGKITSATGSSFVVASMRPTRAPSQTSQSGGAGQSGSEGPATAEITVTTTKTTTYAQTVKATASALSLGSCIAARGKADDTGAIAATSIAVRAKENGTCNSRGPGA